MADGSNEENVFLGHCCGMGELYCGYGYGCEERGERRGEKERWLFE